MQNPSFLRSVGTYFLGTILLVAGVIILVHVMGWQDFLYGIKGWWTFIITIPCLIRFLFDGDKFLSLIGVACGVILYLGCLEVVELKTAFMLLVPIVIILFAIRLLASGKKSKPSGRRK